MGKQDTHFAASLRPPAIVFNPMGRSRFLIVCDHASNHMPAAYDALGLSAIERLMHIAWDPGALAVSKRLSALLDAPLVQSTNSRLLVDPNRGHDAEDLIPEISEATPIPGNAAVSAEERAARIAKFHTPYHKAIAALLDARTARGIESILVAMHSFTPVYHGAQRPWPVGLIHGADTGFTEALFDALKADAPEMNVGWNEPYAARQGIYYTMDLHADQRGLHGTMVEIRHDEILTPAGVTDWTERMARCLTRLLATLPSTPASSPIS